MSSLLFLIIFCALGVLYFILGLMASKNIKTTSDYFLAGRDLGFMPVTFTLIATQVGGGLLLGTAQKAYYIGYYGILYTVGMSLGFLLLGLGFASRLRSLNIATTAELFETVYQSSALKKVASLLSIATMCGILIAQMVASRTLLMGLGITSETLFLLVWLSLIVYIMTGGLRAVAVTDIAQVIVIITVFGSIFIYSLLAEPSLSFASLASAQGYFFSEDISFSNLIAVTLMPTLFSLIEQDLAQQFFASRTKKIAGFAALSASVFLLLFSLIPIYFGMKARLIGLTIAEGTSPLMPVLGILTNGLMIALATCGLLAAITSTANSVLCAASSNLAQDFDFSFLGIRNNLRFSQCITLLIGVASLGASYLVPQNIIDILISSYELSVSCLFVPLIISYFNARLNKNAALGAILFGLAGFIGFRIYPIPFSKEVVTLCLSSMGYLLGNMIKSR